MLLAVDIGNTNISIGVFKRGRLLNTYSIPTGDKKLAACLRKIFASNKIKDAVICSVVPETSKLLERELIRLLHKRPYYIGKDIKIGLKNSYRKPAQVGQDRLVNAYYGVYVYGAPLIIVDFGTAVTFDVVSRKKEYAGGMIMPGVGISLEALCQNTALLPRVKLDKPKEFIGKDTKSSMLSGVIYGFAALTDMLTEQIKLKIGRNARVIGTGGNIDLIAKYSKKINKIDRDLTVKGLQFLYSRK